MKNFKVLYLILLIGLLTACSSTRTIQKTTYDDGKISFTFLQVNDVYEIAPLAGGKEGGMARVATLKKQLLKENPNTFTLWQAIF